MTEVMATVTLAEPKMELVASLVVPRSIPAQEAVALGSVTPSVKIRKTRQDSIVERTEDQGKEEPEESPALIQLHARSTAPPKMRGRAFMK